MIYAFRMILETVIKNVFFEYIEPETSYLETAYYSFSKQVEIVDSFGIVHQLKKKKKSKSKSISYLW